MPNIFNPPSSFNFSHALTAPASYYPTTFDRQSPAQVSGLSMTDIPESHAELLQQFENYTQHKNTKIRGNLWEAFGEPTSQQNYGDGYSVSFFDGIAGNKPLTAKESNQLMHR